MTLSLNSYEKIQNDLSRYQEAISKITNPKVRSNANNLLSQYRSQINLINEAHTSSGTRNTNITAVKDNVFNLVNIRQELEKFVKDAG
jgi:PHP family Zn ribbon phosphoesterase